MGLFSRGPDYSSQRRAGQSLVNSATARADEDKAEYEALRKKQQDDAKALTKRSKTMSGGGRAGLMYGGNTQGVA